MTGAAPLEPRRRRAPSISTHAIVRREGRVRAGIRTKAKATIIIILLLPQTMGHIGRTPSPLASIKQRGITLSIIRRRNRRHLRNHALIATAEAK